MGIAVVFQRFEGAAVFLASTFIYFDNGLSAVYYLVFLLAFDISMVGYLAGLKAGAISYNLGHSLLLPSVLTIAYFMNENNFLLGLICLWFAHIGMDRALGYGLKHSSGFKDTHLGNIGGK